jgi:hypothetical protein
MYHFPQEIASSVVVQPVFAAIDLRANRDKVVPSINSISIAAICFVLPGFRNWGEEDMLQQGLIVKDRCAGG